MRLYKESNHFKFYCYKNDVSVLDALSYKLETYFERITSNLMHIPENKILVEVFPDIEAFQNAMGEPNATRLIIYLLGSICGFE